MVCPHLCIIYFFHSLHLNHSLLYWQSRHLFRISKHGALSNPIWLFHSWCCTSEPDPTNLLHDSTEQTLSKKLSTHSWGFFFGWLVGQFCDSSPLQYFSWCRCHHLSCPGFLSAVGKTRWKPRGQDWTLTVLQERSNVQQCSADYNPRRGEEKTICCGKHHSMPGIEEVQKKYCIMRKGTKWRQEEAKLVSSYEHF